MSKEEMTFKFERPNFPQLEVTMRCDQPPQPLDRAAAFLHWAVEALGQERDLCEKDTDRQRHVADLQAKVAVIQDRVVSIPAP